MTIKKVVALIVGASLLFAASGFAAGMLYQKSQVTGPGDMGDRAMGGPMPGLSEEERAALGSMSEEERQAYFEENLGGQMPGAPGQGGGGGPARGGMLDGEVVEVSGDTLTLKLATSGSQTIYIDVDTVLARAEGAGELAAGASVFVVAEPAADGVTTASLVVVR